MPPQDRTPLGDAMTHRFPEQKIPEPKPDAGNQNEFDSEIERHLPATDPADAPHVPDHGRPPTRQRG